MTNEEIKSHVLYHIMKQYGTQVTDERAWVLPVIEQDIIRPCKISGKVAGNVLVLRLEEMPDEA